MTKRKVNLVGSNTLTVSLPASWTSKNNIQKGDELHVNHTKHEITYSYKRQNKQKKEITINIDTYNTYFLKRYIETSYTSNYDKITLLHRDPYILDERSNQKLRFEPYIKKLVNRFIGLEIISQTPQKTEIGCFLEEDPVKLRQIEKRIYFLFKETIEQLLEAAKGDFSAFHETSYELHDNIVKFIMYYLRILDQAEIPEIQKLYLFSFYSILDRVTDKFRHLSDKIEKYGCTDRVHTLLKEIFNYFFEQIQTLHKQEISKETLSKKYGIYKTLNETDFSKEELRVIDEANAFMHIGTYITLANISANFNNQEQQS